MMWAIIYMAQMHPLVQPVMNKGECMFLEREREMEKARYMIINTHTHTHRKLNRIHFNENKDARTGVRDLL